MFKLGHDFTVVGTAKYFTRFGRLKLTELGWPESISVDQALERSASEFPNYIDAKSSATAAQEAYDAAYREAYASAFEESKKAENERIAAILNAPEAKGRLAAAMAIVRAGTTVEQALDLLRIMPAQEERHPAVAEREAALHPQLGLQIARTAPTGSAPVAVDRGDRQAVGGAGGTLSPDELAEAVSAEQRNKSAIR